MAAQSPRTHHPIEIIYQERWRVFTQAYICRGLRPVDCVMLDLMLAWQSGRDPMAELVLVQRLAAAVARARGLDPDRPRNLTRSVILARR